MTSVDTNVVVRFLVRDDERQAQRARRLFAAGSVFVPKTVLLETEWVLRFSYELPRAVVADGLERICRMAGVTVEDISSVSQAIAWHRQGMDFADALHIASGRAVTAFCSFDRDLQKRAKALGSVEVVTP